MPKSPQILPSEVAELIRIASQHGLSEIRVQEGSHRVEIRLALPAEASFTEGIPLLEPVAPAAETSSELIEIVSPMTGVYYVAPSPGDPAFVRAGDIVNAGDPIGLIEAMKVFSEILSDHAGRVRRLLATNGQLVQQGDTLLELAPLEPGEI